MNTPTIMTQARQVQMPHSYFQTAKSEYSDWRWTMIREFIQNAYDAQATTIDFRLTVEGKLRQSFRRWKTKREVLSSMA